MCFLRFYCVFIVIYCFSVVVWHVLGILCVCYYLLLWKPMCWYFIHKRYVFVLFVQFSNVYLFWYCVLFVFKRSICLFSCFFCYTSCFLWFFRPFHYVNRLFLFFVYFLLVFWLFRVVCSFVSFYCFSFVFVYFLSFYCYFGPFFRSVFRSTLYDNNVDSYFLLWVKSFFVFIILSYTRKKRRKKEERTVVLLFFLWLLSFLFL